MIGLAGPRSRTSASDPCRHAVDAVRPWCGLKDEESFTWHRSRFGETSAGPPRLTPSPRIAGAGSPTGWPRWASRLSDWPSPRPSRLTTSAQPLPVTASRALSSAVGPAADHRCRHGTTTKPPRPRPPRSGPLCRAAELTGDGATGSAALRTAVLKEQAAQRAEELAKGADDITRAASTASSDARQNRLTAADRASARPPPGSTRPGSAGRLPPGSPPPPSARPRRAPSSPAANPGPSSTIPAGGRFPGGGAVSPVPGAVIGAHFGQYGVWSRYHTGLDFRAAYGTPIRAVKSGVVLFAGNSGDWAGNHVAIRHGDGKTTMSSHMSSMAVRLGPDGPGRSGHRLRRPDRPRLRRPPALRALPRRRPVRRRLQGDRPSAVARGQRRADPLRSEITPLCEPLPGRRRPGRFLIRRYRSVIVLASHVFGGHSLLDGDRPESSSEEMSACLAHHRWARRRAPRSDSRHLRRPERLAPARHRRPGRLGARPRCGRLVSLTGAAQGTAPDARPAARRGHRSPTPGSPPSRRPTPRPPPS